MYFQNCLRQQGRAGVVSPHIPGYWRVWRLCRQTREDEIQSKKARKESAKEAMRAEKMRRAAEHLGDVSQKLVSKGHPGSAGGCVT